MKLSVLFIASFVTLGITTVNSATAPCADVSNWCKNLPSVTCTPRYGWHYLTIVKHCRKHCNTCTDRCGRPPVPTGKRRRYIDRVTHFLIQKWPWNAQIWRVTHGQRKLLCNGVIIKSDFLLTSAECLHNVHVSEIEINLGSSVLNVRKKVYKAHKVIQHSDFNLADSVDRNNIAIVELNGYAYFSDTIHPVCLPSQHEQPSVGLTCYLTGWNGGLVTDKHALPYVLKEMQVTVLSNTECQSLFPSLRSMTNSTLCAVKTDKKSNMNNCGGEPGSPLVCQYKSNSWKVFGTLIKTSKSCDTSSFYAFFTRTGNYMDWIDNYM